MIEWPSIPLFPPSCIVPAVEHMCTALGITVPCVATPSQSGSLFGDEIFLGHWLTFLSLIFIGVINLSYVKFPVEFKDAMKITTGLYAIITAVFSITRLYFGVSRFLVIGAALHNLFEWSMLMQIASVNTTVQKVQKTIRWFAFFIFFVIVLIVMMPTLATAVLSEQATGITIDFGLVFVFNYLYWFGQDSTVKDFYQLPAFAHTIHLFFTILPLVFANFHAGFTTWYNSFYLESAIYLSAPITHILYMTWSFKFDEVKMEGKEKDKTGVLPPIFRATHLKLFVALGFLCGIITLVIFPLALGQCSAPPGDLNCVPTSAITGTAEATVYPGFGPAFEDLIHSENLVQQARLFPGNKEYTLYKDVRFPNKYRFIETWESEVAMRDWLAKVGSVVFSKPAIQNLLVGGRLTGLSGYTPTALPECHGIDKDKVTGGVVVSVQSSCSSAWSVISNWTDCSWVIGCQYAVVNPKTNVRTLNIADGSKVEVALRKLEPKTHVLVYEIIGPAALQSRGLVGYTGQVTVGDTEDQLTLDSPTCTILYQFTIPKETASSAAVVKGVYDDFLKNRVPGLQKLFKGNA